VDAAIIGASLKPMLHKTGHHSLSQRFHTCSPRLYPVPWLRFMPCSITQIV